jgi:hypothetical protein
VKQQLGLLAVLFLLAHLLYLPPTLEDVDSVNFALAVRDFDVAKHQPHPPGYPIFTALAKASTALVRAIGVPSAGARGLSLLSAVSGAILVVLLFALYSGLTTHLRIAWWAMALAVCSPLFWFTALRPLSDVTGLAFAVAAQACLVWALGTGGGIDSLRPNGASGQRDRVPADPQVASGFRPGAPGPLLLAGAFLAGLAAGVRSQTVMLTAPLLLAVLVWPRLGLGVHAKLTAIGAAAAGMLAWAIPLLVASGGPGAYLLALDKQAGEDFSGVVMLWTTWQARVAADALLYSFVWPWGSVQLGTALMGVAAAGLLRLMWRSPRPAALLLIAFAPYAVFHLLFHETLTVRYALPLVIPVAFLLAYAAAALGRYGLPLTAGSIIVVSLVMTLPAVREYAVNGSPAFRLFSRAIIRGDGSSGGSRAAGGVVAMHAVMRRVEEWHQDDYLGRAIYARDGREWLALVDHWRRRPQVPVRFLADPRRTDLALFDPHARQLEASERWTFAEMPFVAGTRPGGADAYMMRPPGWMLERGWALTAEVGGVTAKEGAGPHVEPSVAWVQARPEEASLIIGGRNLSGDDGPAARVTIQGGSGPIDSWDVPPGFFFRHVQFPAGALAGTGYVPLRISAVAADHSGRQVRVALEQFDLQSAGSTMIGYVDGWHEPEYNPSTARSWRWMSERARLLVKPVDRDVRLTITGESPLRYFNRPPTVRVLAAGVEVARFNPASDFRQDVPLPARALRLSGGVVVLESELWFTPAERGESADRRHLALRIYSATVE